MITKEQNMYKEAFEYERNIKNELNKELVLADNEIQKQSGIIEELNKVIERQNDEIIKLKAKLYDIMCERR